MKNSSTLVLVGGFGFVGRNILDVVAQDKVFRDLNPVVIDDLSNACPGHEALDLPFHAGSCQDQGALDFLERLEDGGTGRIFIFLAGETRVAESINRPLDFINANITEPSRFVMNAVRPGDKFILISTAGALFDGTFEVSVDSPYCPKNFYGATKAAEEMILGKLVELRGGEFSIIRLTNVFGRFSDTKKSAIHAFTRAVISGEPVFINGDGQQSRDFIYAGDVARGIAGLAAKLHAGETTNPINMLGSGTSTTLMDVVRVIEDVAGKTLNYEKIAATELLKTEPRDVIASKDDVKELLGENITSFADGVRQTHAYYEI